MCVGIENPLVVLRVVIFGTVVVTQCIIFGTVINVVAQPIVFGTLRIIYYVVNQSLIFDTPTSILGYTQRQGPPSSAVPNIFIEYNCTKDILLIMKRLNC